MSERWVTWVEPWGPNQEPIYCFAPESTCITWIKKRYPELTDESVLNNFMIVYWASFTEKPASIKEHNEP
jgi:hypothetical protein